MSNMINSCKKKSRRPNISNIIILVLRLRIIELKQECALTKSI